MSDKINIIENAVDFRLGLLIKAMHNEMKITENKLCKRNIPLHLLIEQLQDDLVMYVGEEKYNIDENVVKRRIKDRVENILNDVEVQFTDTDMIITIQEVA